MCAGTGMGTGCGVSSKRVSERASIVPCTGEVAVWAAAGVPDDLALRI